MLKIAFVALVFVAPPNRIAPEPKIALARKIEANLGPVRLENLGERYRAAKRPSRSS